MAVCSEIHTKHINTVCGQNVEFVNVKLAVHIVTTGQSDWLHTVNRILYRALWHRHSDSRCFYSGPALIGNFSTATINIQQFYVLPTQLYLCVLCGSQNKHPLFPYTTLTD